MKVIIVLVGWVWSNIYLDYMIKIVVGFEKWFFLFDLNIYVNILLCLEVIIWYVLRKKVLKEIKLFEYIEYFNFFF